MLTMDLNRTLGLVLGLGCMGRCVGVELGGGDAVAVLVLVLILVQVQSEV
jgi:hypothetical protein